MRVFIPGLLAILCLSTAHGAPARRQLVLLTYSSAGGHGLALGSYVSVFRVDGFANERVCEIAGNGALKTFKAQLLPNAAQLLPAYMCEVEK